MKGYSLGLYEKAMPCSLPWREKLAAAGKAGYDFVEMSIDESEEKLDRLDMSVAERLDLVGLMAHTGIPIRTMCLSGHRKFPLGSADPKVSQRGMEIMGKAIQLADDLGIRIIQLAGYDVYYEESNLESKKRFLANLKRAVGMAGSSGVVLGFETMENEFMNTVEKAMKYVTLVQSSYLNVYPDIGNITNAASSYKTDVLEDLYIGKGHLVAMHLKETTPGKFREIPYGSGHVDFEGAISMAWSLGIRKYVAEFWHTGSPAWEEELKAVNAMFTNLLREKEQNFDEGM